MAGKAKPVPDGFHTVTPHLVLDDCARAIEFYQTAFGAREGRRQIAPGGKIAHAEIQIGDSTLMMSDEEPPMPGQTGVFKSPRSAGLSTAALFQLRPAAIDDGFHESRVPQQGTALKGGRSRRV